MAGLAGAIGRRTRFFVERVAIRPARDQEVHDLFVAVPGGLVEGCLLLVVAYVARGTLLEQHPNEVRALAVDGFMEHRVPEELLAHLEIHPVREKDLDGVGMTGFDGPVQRTASVVVACLRIGSQFEQDPNELAVAEPGGVRERRVPERVPGIHTAAP